MFIIYLKYYYIIWSVIEYYGHILDTYGHFIDGIWSFIKCIWSVYRRYVHNVFEILLYYMVNNRVIWS